MEYEKPISLADRSVRTPLDITNKHLPGPRDSRTSGNFTLPDRSEQHLEMGKDFG